MELTLRQARNLEIRLRNLSIDNQIIEVRAYDSAVARADILEGVEDLGSEINSKLELNDVRHEIKRLINVKNMECGVSDLLNQRDCLYSKRDILNTLGPSDNVERQISHIRSSPKPRRMVSVYNEELEDSVEQDLADIDHELNEISRELNDKNVTLTIKMSEEDVAILKENGVL